MGLDWNPANKARPGREREFKTVTGELKRRAEQGSGGRWWRNLLARRFSVGRSDDQLWADFESVAITPHETLDAPRVGIDEAATAWAREQYAALKKKSDTVDDFLAAMRGHRVLALVPKCDGLPVYSNGGLYEGADLDSFRGAFLSDCVPVIGEALLNEAWEERDAKALLDYGDRLAQAARAYAETNGTTEWLTRREPPDLDKGPAHQTHVVSSAARWCRFWAERGHGLEPYF